MRKEKILVVDDDTKWLQTIKRILGTDYELQLTTEPSEAVAFTRRSDFALAILDQRMPGGVTGLDLLTQLRAIRPDLPGIILTGYPALDDATKSTRVASDYISKGVGNLEDTLRSSVETVISEMTYEVAPAPNGDVPSELLVDGSEERYVEVDCTDRVRLADLIRLNVRIAVSKPLSGLARRLALTIPEAGLFITVVVKQSEGLEALDPLSVPVVLVRGADSPWVFFRFKPLRRGAHSVLVRIFNGGTLAESVRVQIGVDDDAVRRRYPVRRPFILRDRGIDEVALDIEFDRHTRRYFYQWFDRYHHPVPPRRSKPLWDDPHKIVGGFIGQMNQLERGSIKFGMEELRAHLTTRGVGLWDQLIPPELQQDIADRTGAATRLTLFTGDDPMLWELLYPRDQGSSGRFLIEQFLVTRWSSDDPAPETFGDRESVIVVPHSHAPQTADAEAAALASLLGQRGTVKQLSDLMPLLARLDTPLDVLHFACHNTFTSAGSRINFPSGYFDPQSLLNKSLSSRPLVFINACRSEGYAETYTNLTSWAKEFIDAGAGGFVGTLWEVRDQSASRFAEAFYKELFEGGTPIALAMSRAREAIKASGDPTWLAYTLYADPTASFR